jgi:general stress protein 26
MEKNLQSAAALEKLKELVESVHICMYCTIEHGSDMASRPMGTAKIEDDGTIWFFTTDHSGAAEEAGKEAEVCLNYSHPGKNTYLCLMGQSELVFDKAKMTELWNPMLKTWFPDGVETENIALVKVTPRSAHYWDSDASRLRLLFSFLKAQVTGEAAHGTEGDHGDLDVDGAGAGNSNRAQA